MNLVVRLYPFVGVIGKGGQIGELIETGVVAFALISIELKLGDVATAFGRTAPADITEAAGDVHVGIGHDAHYASLCNHVQGDGIHEILTVGAFEDAQDNAVGTYTAIAWAPSHTRDDVRCAQVQTSPGVRPFVSGHEGGQVSVEGICHGVDCLRG